MINEEVLLEELEKSLSDAYEKMNDAASERIKNTFHFYNGYMSALRHIRKFIMEMPND